MINGAILYAIAIILISISFIKDRNKTKDAVLKSWKMFRNIIPDILSIMLFVGLSLSILTPTLISSIIGEKSGLIGIAYSTLIGSVALIPSFIVFPLGDTLVQNGAGLPQVAALMSSLMSVGITTLPMEQKIIWSKFCLYSQCICNINVSHICLYYLGGDGMNELKKYRFFFILLFGLIILNFYKPIVGMERISINRKKHFKYAVSPSSCLNIRRFA